MVTLNAKKNKLNNGKDFATKDTSYSSFWMFNKERDINSLHLRDSFVNFYDDKELLSEFNPTIAKNIISFWSNPKDKILDPFSGRTRALVSYAMDRSYVGYEVSGDVINHMKTKFDELEISGRSNFEVTLEHDDCLNNNYKDEYFDLVFSCPPYWDLEKYEHCDGQLSDIKMYDKFIDELVLRLNKSASKLKENGYMCMVVGDFRRKGKYITFHSDLITKMKKLNNLKLHDVIVIQNLPFYTAAFYAGTSKRFKRTAKAHEYLLVWKKIKQNVPDKETIKCERCGIDTEKRNGKTKYCEICSKMVNHEQRLRAKRKSDAKKRML